MRVIRRVGEVTLAEHRARERCPGVRFRLNHPPDPAWIDLFRAHAGASPLGMAVVFDGAAASAEIAKAGTAAELATAIDSFIECANLGLRAFPGRVPEQTARPRLVAARFRPRA